VSNSFSVAKSIVSILTGIALKEGSIRDIDQPVGDFLPAFGKGARARITIRHLLTMCSGLNWDESYINPFSMTTKAYYGKDLKGLIMNLEAVEEPGRVFKYLSGNTLVLAMVLEKATGMNLSKYASEKLWKPLGAGRSALWSLDKKDGREKAYCCFNSNARDFARMGQLYLDRGMWKGRRLVPADYVAASTRPAPLVHPDGRPCGIYGYSWWLARHRDMRIFYARGILGQYIICIPEKRMVIVRLGHKRGPKNSEGQPEDLYLYVDAAMDMIGR